MKDISETLKERKVTHGPFAEYSEAAQALKSVIRFKVSVPMSNIHKEALDNICGKIARIITGDPDHSDSWYDIAGYATLVVQHLETHGKDNE